METNQGAPDAPVHPVHGRHRASTRVRLASLSPAFVSSFLRRSTVVIQSIQRDVLDDSAVKRLPPIYLPRVAFWLAWLLVCGLQITAMLFLFIFGLVYYRIAQPGLETVRVVYYLPSIAALRVMAVIMILVAILYVVNLKRMVSASIARGRLAFRPVAGPVSAPTRDELAERPSIVRRFAARLWLAYRTIFGRRGVLGLENRYFERVFILREGVEIVSQSYQSYRLSLFVAMPSVNALACLLLLINCWSTPVIHALLRRNTSAQRVSCLVVDVALQFVWAIAIPVRLMAPFIRAYNVVQQRFPEQYAADNTFMLAWEMQSQQVLASSIGDFLTKLIPLISIVAACRAIGNTLEEPTGPTTSQIVPILPGAERTKPTVITASTTEREFWLRWSNRKMSYGEKTVHAGYALWGFVAVAVQLRANQVAAKGANTSCLVELRPWFGTAYSCALVELDCFYFERFHGLTTVIEMSDRIDYRLSTLDPLAVQFLSFTHCTALVVPSKVQSLTNLRGVEIFNSTIVHWDSRSAALTQLHHPSLRRLSIVRCPLDQVPAALLIDDLPTTLVLLNLVATNLRTLPDSVHVKWRHVRFLVLEQSALDGVPTALTQMRLGRLGLTGSNLTVLPEFPLARFEHFVVGNNPLEKLPNNIGDLAAIAWLSFDNTNVKIVPAWLSSLERNTSARVFARGTPYCSTAKPDTLGCDSVNPRSGGMYPVGEETKRRTAALLALGL